MKCVLPPTSEKNSNFTFIMVLQSANALAAGRMPNCTGLESVHALMIASQSKKKISLLEACCVDSNRAAFQVAAYIRFESSVHRGTSPTIFELALRHVDMAGSAAAHEKATNFFMEANGKFDLLRTKPLNSDLQASSLAWLASKLYLTFPLAPTSFTFIMLLSRS